MTQEKGNEMNQLADAGLPPAGKINEPGLIQRFTESFTPGYNGGQEVYATVELYSNGEVKNKNNQFHTVVKIDLMSYGNSATITFLDESKESDLDIMINALMKLKGKILGAKEFHLRNKLNKT